MQRWPHRIAISEYIISDSKGRISEISSKFAKNKYVLSVEFVNTFKMIDDAYTALQLESQRKLGLLNEHIINKKKL